MGQIEEKDNINPDHYKSQCSIECIEAMEMAFGAEAVVNFCLCNAFKYLWRHKYKNNYEDLKKAAWYTDRARYEMRIMDRPEVYKQQLVAIDRVIEEYAIICGGSVL